MKPEISMEQLNAFIDNELDLTEKDSMFAALDGNPELAHQLCALRAVKEMVSHGYAEPPPPRQQTRSRQFDVPRYWSVGLMLALGIAMGWLGRDWNDPTQAVQMVEDQTDVLRPVSLAGVSADTRKIVLHVDSAEPVKLKTLLDDVDYLLAQQASHGKPVQVEVITNNYGVNLLRADVSPYAARIEALTRQHANISFIACGQTMRRLTREGVEVELLPQAQVAPTAIGQIINRLQHGWTYIKV